jgi:outer membrane protein
MRQVAVVVATAITVVGGAWLATAQGPAPPPQKVGFIDVQRVLARSQAGLAAREQLEREKATMQKDVDKNRVEIEKLREELEKKGLVLSADAKREKEEVLQRKIRDLRRMSEDLQKELQTKEQALTQRILQELTTLIERIGKEKGFLLILERRSAGVIYGDAEADVTEEVIRAYDQEKGRK